MGDALQQDTNTFKHWQYDWEQLKMNNHKLSLKLKMIWTHINVEWTRNRFCLDKFKCEILQILFPIPLQVTEVVIYRSRADVVIVESKPHGLISRQPKPHIMLHQSFLKIFFRLTLKAASVSVLRERERESFGCVAARSEEGVLRPKGFGRR